MRLLNILRKFKKIIQNNSQKHLLRIEINSRQLLQNIQVLKEKFPQHQLSAVLKGNAYGHGLKEMATFLENKKEIKYFCVDSLMEAKIIRDLGLKKPIIILGYVLKDSLRQLKRLKNVVLIVNSLKQAQDLKQLINFPLAVHLKVDTGMHRHGIIFSDLEGGISILKENSYIKIDGLMTHFADADNQNSEFTLQQLKIWQEAIKIYRNHFSNGLLHFSATAGTNYLEQAESNFIRIGAALYGFDVTKDKILKVKPILSFWAKVVNIKDLKKGEFIGYGCTFRAEQDMKIALVPCGYFEGVPRISSNQGYVYFKDKPLRILGRVSMNLTALDATGIDIKLEDEIEIFSADLQRLNSVENYAKICKTGIHDISVHLASGIKRVVHLVK